MATWPRVRAMSALLIVLVIFEAHLASAVDQDVVEQLKQELEAMKRRLEKIEKQTQEQQETIRRQSETIRQLSGQKAAPGQAAPAAMTSEELAAHDEQLKKDVTEGLMRRIQPALAAANKTFPSQFNPAIGFIIDTVGSYSSNNGGNFELRAAELGISASVDPFVRGYAIISGSNQGGFDVEEAAIVTTSLPYNLGLKGGRFFADFGRLSKTHDHDLPFVNRPIVLDEYVDGESQADGVEGSWLVPISQQYVTLTAGAYNKMGAENERVSNVVPRNFSEFTYLGKAFTFLPLTDANSLDLGLSGAFTPVVKEDNGAKRSLGDLELTYRYTPLSQAAYRGFVWGTEALLNYENRPIGGFVESPGSTPLVFEHKNAVGLYTYVEPRLTRRFYPGFLFQYAQDINPGVGSTLAYSPYLTVWASEFQRLRLQYQRLEAPGNHDNQFFLQWTVILGSHVHGFKDR